MIELSRTITFGQYINNGSSLTRMDPRAKLFCFVLMIALVSYVGNFTAFVVCLLFCLIMQWLSHISTPYVLRSFKPFMGFLIFITLLQVLFYYSPTQHKTQLWQWWILNIAWEGIIRGILTLIRVLFLYYLVSMLLFTTSLIDLTDGSEALLSPLQKIGVPVNAFVMVLVIAFKFVPIFIAEIERLMKAQSARGMRFDKGNLFQRTSKLATLLIPLFVSAFKRAELLSTAMEARCYGGRPGWRRSKRRLLRFKRFDVLVTTFTLVVCITAITAYLLAPF